MNAKNAKDYLPLVQALAEGKTIQYRTICKGSGISPDGWFDLSGDMGFENPPESYRIKPEPRIWWIVLSDESMSTDGINEYYHAYKKPVPINPYCKLIEVVEVQK